MSAWRKVFEHPARYRAEIVRDFLMEEDIAAIILDQVPSSHPIQSLGTVKVMVKPEDVIPAIQLIKNNINFETN